jgi:ribosome-associated translation inhibitor RaiA
MKTTIQAINFKLKKNAHIFIEEKIQDSVRVLGDMNLDAVRIEVVLEQSSARHLNERETEQRFQAEARVSLPGHPIHVQTSAPELEQAIVKLKHVLTRELRHHRERRIDGSRKGARLAKSMTHPPDASLTPDLPEPTPLETWLEPELEEPRVDDTDLEMLEEDLRDFV